MEHGLTQIPQVFAPESKAVAGVVSLNPCKAVLSVYGCYSI